MFSLSLSLSLSPTQFSLSLSLSLSLSCFILTPFLTSLSSSFKHVTGVRLEVGVSRHGDRHTLFFFFPLILSLSSSSLPLSHLYLLLLSMPPKLGWKSAWRLACGLGRPTSCASRWCVNSGWVLGLISSASRW